MVQEIDIATIVMALITATTRTIEMIIETSAITAIFRADDHGFYKGNDHINTDQFNHDLNYNKSLNHDNRGHTSNNSYDVNYYDFINYYRN